MEGENGGETMNRLRKGAQLLVMVSAALVASMYVLADSETSKDDHVETGAVGKSFADTATDTSRSGSINGASAVDGVTGSGEYRCCTNDVVMRPEPPAMLFFGLGLIGLSQIAKRKKKNTPEQF
jgi:hypothetical protein